MYAYLHWVVDRQSLFTVLFDYLLTFCYQNKLKQTTTKTECVTKFFIKWKLSRLHYIMDLSKYYSGWAHTNADKLLWPLTIVPK